MHTQHFPQLESVEIIEQGFESFGYLVCRLLPEKNFLAFPLRKPILLEVPPGVGKTEMANTIALLLAPPLVRLLCY